MGGEGSDEDPDAEVRELEATETVGLERKEVVRFLNGRSINL